MKKEANYQLTSSVNEGILEITLTGTLLTSDVAVLQRKVSDIVKATEVKAMLVDSRNVDGRKISLTEMYTTARRDFLDGPAVTTAVVDREENMDLLSFMETTALNAGWSFKAFIDIDAARSWLKSKLAKR